MSDKLKLQGVFSQGYGIIPKAIMKDKDLTIEAKAIYSYLASYAGAGNTAFPSISLMISDLCIGEERFYKHRKLLVEKGYLIIEEGKKEKGKFHKNVYVLNNSPYPQNKGTDNPSTDKPSTDNPSTDEPSTDNKGTNNNSSNNNSINNNSIKKERRNSKEYDDDSPYIQAAKYLFMKIKKNNDKVKEPNYQKWADDIRKLVELDKNSLEEVKKIIDWSQSDDFWKLNILSSSSLRKQFVKLWGQAEQESKPASRKVIQKEKMPDWNTKPVDETVNNSNASADEVVQDPGLKSRIENLKRMSEERNETGGNLSG